MGVIGRELIGVGIPDEVAPKLFPILDEERTGSDDIPIEALNPDLDGGLT